LSNVPFHFRPDGAAIFLDPSSTNYKYVSNSEALLTGGVGALSFDKDGNVIGYERLLTGTIANCGGGKTFWNTWLTCEEWFGGHVWEVNPFTGTSRRTELSRGYAARYESAAYDHRNIDQPVFYATIDRKNGPLVKFTPPAAAVQTARATKDYSQLLHTKVSDRDRAASYQYLVVDPSTLTFTWTSDVKVGERTAAQYFRNCEGIGKSYTSITLQ
jgi:secreted PhoX family phosphatase